MFVLVKWVWELKVEKNRHILEPTKCPKNPWDVMGCQNHLFGGPRGVTRRVWGFHRRGSGVLGCEDLSKREAFFPNSYGSYGVFSHSKGTHRVVAVGVFFGLILEYLTVKGF